MGDEQSKPSVGPDQAPDLEPVKPSAIPEAQASDEKEWGEMSDDPNAGSPDGIPVESTMMVGLMQALEGCPNRSASTQDIKKRLPVALKKIAEANDRAISRWCGKFPTMFKVSGKPGDETVTLLLGSQPTLPETNDSPSSEPAAPPSTAGFAENTEAEDTDSLSSTVQLRGLPFRATIADIRTFLGSYSEKLTSEQPIRLLLNQDNRPSGFARVHFTSPEAARDARANLHRKSMGDRYIEVLTATERSNKQRRREATIGDGTGTVPGESIPCDPQEKERVLQEVRCHLGLPGRQGTLLSMLGIALSPQSRLYLRNQNLGLKHFLTRYPHEFSIDGPKGTERVTWHTLPGSVPVSQGFHGMPFNPYGGMPAMMPMPTLPLQAFEEPSISLVEDGERTPMQSPGPRAIPQTADSMAMMTHSPWASPAGRMGGDLEVEPPEDFSNIMGGDMSGGVPFASPDDWAMLQMGQMAGMEAACPWGGMMYSDYPAPPFYQGGYGQDMYKYENRPKKSTRHDATTSRSHAHLHPQSHPFANKVGTKDGATASAEGDSTTSSVLRLRGLPFSVTVQDVLAFFAQHDVADLISEKTGAAQLLAKANGKPSGQAVVQMRSRRDAECAARALDKQCVGPRYIEVFVYGEGSDFISEQPGQGDPPAPESFVASPQPPIGTRPDLEGTPQTASMGWASGEFVPPMPGSGGGHSEWSGFGSPMGPAGAAGQEVQPDPQMDAMFSFLNQPYGSAHAKPTSTVQV